MHGVTSRRLSAGQARPLRRGVSIARRAVELVAKSAVCGITTALLGVVFVCAIMGAYDPQERREAVAGFLLSVSSPHEIARWQAIAGDYRGGLACAALVLVNAVCMWRFARAAGDGRIGTGLARCVQGAALFFLFLMAVSEIHLHRLLDRAGRPVQVFALRGHGSMVLAAVLVIMLNGYARGNNSTRSNVHPPD